MSKSTEHPGGFLDQFKQIAIPASIAGFTSNTICHPLDTLKTRNFQVNPDGKRKYSSIIDVLRVTRRSEGLQSLWKGLSVVLLTSMPLTTIYFGAYEMSFFLAKQPMLKLIQLRNENQSNPISMESANKAAEESALVHFSSGILAQVFAALFFTPTDVIKERLQTMESKNSSPIKIVRDLVAKEGVSALFKGYGLAVALWAPYGAIFLSVSHSIKNFASERKPVVSSTLIRHVAPAHDKNSPAPVETHQELSFLQHLSISAFSAGLAAWLTNGVDLVKVNMQIGAFSSDASLWNIVKNLYKRDTWFFTRGSLARVLYLSPRTALSFGIYEWVKGM